MRKICIRADINDEIGFGHFFRCIALAEMLQQEFLIEFFLKPESLSGKNIPSIPWAIRLIANDDEFLSLLRSNEIVLMDGYDFSDYTIRMITQRHRLVLVNDIPSVKINADVILNHAPGMTKDRYAGSHVFQYALGLDFAMLRLPFLNYAQQKHNKENKHGMFVCMGGADPFLISERILKFLDRQKFGDPVTVITSLQKYDHLDNLIRTLSIRNNTSLHKGVDGKEMLNMITTAKVAVVPSSTLSLEVIASRTALITLYYVDNQKFIHEGIVRQNLGVSLGFFDSDYDDSGLTGILDLYQDEELQSTVIENQINAMDGLSPKRIVSLFQMLS